MTKLPVEMIKKYVSRRELDLELMKKGLGLGEVEDFNRIGHQLMGNARSFGFENLEKITIRMENLSKENLKSIGPIILQELSEWILQEKSILK